MRMRSSRLVPLVLVLALASLGLAIIACGNSDSDGAASSPPSSSSESTASPPASNQTSSLSLTALRDCAQVRGSGGAVLTQGETDRTRYGDELDASAPQDVVRQAVAAGGWLRLTYEREELSDRVRVGAMDILDFGAVEAAKGGENAARAGKDDSGNAIADYYYVVRLGQLVVVYENSYHEDRGGSTAVPGVIATAQACLAKLGSSARLPEPKRVLDEPVE
jgi:hypothetical protein